MYSIAIQGIKGSYSEEAAIKLFGNNANIRGFSSFFETFQALLIKKVEYAVIPIQNTIIGEISSAVKLFKQADVRVIDEVLLDIHHILVGTNYAQLDQVKSVRSHIAALDQCKNYFDSNRQIKQIIGADTASSIRRVISDGIPANAAIGSPMATEIYGGKVLSENIANQQNNQTTFYLIENKSELY